MSEDNRRLALRSHVIDDHGEDIPWGPAAIDHQHALLHQMGRVVREHVHETADEHRVARMSDLYRTTEPLGAIVCGKLTIIPAGCLGVLADPWPEEDPDSLAFIVDEPDGKYDMARAPEVTEDQYEAAS